MNLILIHYPTLIQDFNLWFCSRQQQERSMEGSNCWLDLGLQASELVRLEDTQIVGLVVLQQVIRMIASEEKEVEVLLEKLKIQEESAEQANNSSQPTFLTEKALLFKPKLSTYRFDNMTLASFSLLGLPETKLWEQGIKTFLALLKKRPPASQANKDSDLICQQIRQMQDRYYCKDYTYFQDNLPNKLRLADSIDEIAYLDIETTGLRHIIGDKFKITSIVLFDGYSIKYYLNGYNLHQFKQDIRSYKAVVTFNGNRFDLPEIARELGVDWKDIISFDLMAIMRELGLKGGLKKIKEELKITHPILKDVNGMSAPLLWEKYQTGDEEALKVLIAYNAEDVIPMRYMLEYAIQHLRKREGITSEEEEKEEQVKLKEMHQENQSMMEQFLRTLQIDLQKVKDLIKAKEK